MNSKKSSNQIFDLSFPSTEIEGFDTNITLSDALDQPLTTFLKTKASALNEIILDDDDDDNNSTVISKAPKLGFKQSTIICIIPNFSLE
jgi:hypothetical protein